ncbi:Putative CBL-interacting kinase 13-like protein [Cladobotryum mycophilum]|uniref:CBL-interacting kinase 13-like protein n=1 Tax=Cladobotryum mycophilum TaxID=491253 RepID=A0ABR0T029_9HYPO
MKGFSAQDAEMIYDEVTSHHQDRTTIITQSFSGITSDMRSREETQETETALGPAIEPQPKTTSLSSIIVPAYNSVPNCWTEADQVQALTQAKSFSPDKYLRGKFLGVGGNSTVLKVLRVVDLEVFAGKRSSTTGQLRREATVLQRYRHDHILRFVDMYQEGQNRDSALLVTELCDAGTLQARINHAPDGIMDHVEILQVILQISSALAFLHSQSVYHSDVKPFNILVRQVSPINVVLADLADLKNEGQSYYPPRGTPSYWPPQIVRFMMHGGKTDDVWALGITLLGMMGQWPRLMNTKEELRRYPTTCFNHIRVLRDLNPKHKLISLLCQMTAYKPSSRASAETCRATAQELLEDLLVGGEEEAGLGIKSPENFAPISFW